MQDKLGTILKAAKYEPEPSLAPTIWRKIELREKRSAYFKLWAFVFFIWICKFF